MCSSYLDSSSCCLASSGSSSSSTSTSLGRGSRSKSKFGTGTKCPEVNAANIMHNEFHIPLDLPSGEGRTVVITGGNRGIGFEAVKKLLPLGYKVLIGCRNPAKCQKDLEKLKENGILGDNPQYDCLELDLTKLHSVRKFADEILKKNTPIHTLVNNGNFRLINR